MLEDEGLAAEEDEEIERDFQVMEKEYPEVAEKFLGWPRKRKKPWISDESWNLVDRREQITKNNPKHTIRKSQETN